MLFKKFLATAVAFLLGATEVAAVTHGEVTDYNGGQVKWHQLGKGMWSGIPIVEWDDSVHKRSDVDYGLDNIDLRSLGEPVMSHNLRNGARSLELESRNFKDTCQAIAACATGYEDIQIAGVLGVVVEAINGAAIAVGTIWDLLNNKPFLTTVVGGTVATIVGIRGEKLLWPPPAAQCSTAGTDKDTFSSAFSQGLSSHPDASSISVDVTGPEFAYTATMTATTGTSPPAPVVGQCFTA